MSYDATVTGLDPLILTLANGETLEGAEALGQRPSVGDTGILVIDNRRPTFYRHTSSEDLRPGELTDDTAAEIANNTRTADYASELAREVESTTRDLDAAFTDARAELDALDVALRALDDELAGLDDILDGLDGDLGGLQDELAQARADVAAAMLELEGHDSRINDAVDAIADAEQVAAAAKSAADTAQAAALGAQATADAANTKATTADGRITVAAGNPTAADGLGKPLGAIWEVRSGATSLRRFMLTALSPNVWTQVTAGQDFIGVNAIGTAQIADAAIGTAQIADAAITNAKIGNATIEHAKIKSVNADDISTGTLNADRIGAGAITTGKLAATAVTAEKLAVGAVVAEKIATDAVTAVKIAADAVTAAKIQANAVTTVKLNAGAVTSDKITADAGWFTKLSARSAEFNTAFAGKLTAESIGSGTLSGVNIFSPSPTSLPRLEITGPVLNIKRGSADEGERTSVNLGGATADEVVLYDDLGDPMSGFLASGEGLVRENLTVGGRVAASALSVDGVDFGEMLRSAPRGVLSRFHETGVPGNLPRIGGNEVGLLRFSHVDIHPDRMYRVFFRMSCTSDVLNDFLMLTLRERRGGPTVTAVTTSTIIDSQPYRIDSNSKVIEAEFLIDGLWSDGPWNTSLLISARNLTANRLIRRTGDLPVLAYVEDIGPRENVGYAVMTTAGGIPYDGSQVNPPAQKQTYTKLYAAIDSQAYYGSGTISDGNFHHGVYGGITRHSWIEFHNAVRTDTAGGTIKKVELRLRNTHTWNGRSTDVRISTSSALSAPASGAAAASGSGNAITIPWTHGADAWVNITSAGWTPGSTVSVVLGKGASGNGQYSKFARPAGLTNIQLRVTYEK